MKQSHAIIVIAWLNNSVIHIEKILSVGSSPNMLKKNLYYLRKSFDKNFMSMLLEHHLNSCAVSLADDVHALGRSLDLNTVGIVDGCAL